MEPARLRTICALGALAASLCALGHARGEPSEIADAQGGVATAHGQFEVRPRLDAAPERALHGGLEGGARTSLSVLYVRDALDASVYTTMAATTSDAASATRGSVRRPSAVDDVGATVEAASFAARFRVLDGAGPDSRRPTFAVAGRLALPELRRGPRDVEYRVAGELEEDVGRVPALGRVSVFGDVALVGVGGRFDAARYHPSGAFGAALDAGRGLAFSAEADWQGATSGRGPEVSDLAARVRYRLSPSTRLVVDVVHGLRPGGPGDAAIEVGIGYRFSGFGFRGGRR